MLIFLTQGYIFIDEREMVMRSAYAAVRTSWVVFNKHVIFSFPNLVHIKVNSELFEGIAHWKEWVKQY